MKNEKICFNKNVGIITIVGMVLIGLLLLSQVLMNTQLSTDSRAAQAHIPNCWYIMGKLVCIPDQSQKNLILTPTPDMSYLKNAIKKNAPKNAPIPHGLPGGQ